ncbi:MAG: alpha/beta hydrolase [Planctomycetaceae bacterium]
MLLVLWEPGTSRGPLAQEQPPAQSAEQPAASAALRDLPARRVPVPGTISEELAQKTVSLPVRVFPLPESLEGWKAAQQKLDQERAATARAAAERLQAQLTPVTIAGVRGFEITPAVRHPERTERLLVHLHGGAYVLGSGEAGTLEAILLATQCQTRVISIDYRMPPDHPFPAAVDDAITAWKELTARHDPRHVALFGTSAGGGLVMATMLRIKEQQLPRPAALFLGTPWSDLTKTGDSYFTHAELDNVLGRYEGFLELSAKLYAGGVDLKNPLLSPVNGDLRDFPPTILATGTRDLFLSNTVRVHRRLRQAGVTAELHVAEAQSHADYLRGFPAPESQELLEEIDRFFDRHLR